MTWREVWLRYQGVIQSEAPLRRAAYLVHRSLVPKPVDIEKEWPLPFDVRVEHNIAAQYERLKKIIELKQQHGNPTA